MNELTHIDLFSGIGGFTLAAEWAGFRTVAFSEIQPQRCLDLETIWPGIPNLGDIRRDIDWRPFRGTTLLTGGFPCQPWSFSGEKLGIHDPRHLWPSMLHAISQTRPTWVVGENVTGIIGMEFADMLTDLEGIGYTCQPIVIPACAVGADHERNRIWILANSTGDGLSGPRECGEPIDSAPNAFEEASSFVDAFRRNALPFVCGRHDGIPKNRAESLLAGLGNAIVPQVAYQIIKAIAQIERGEIA